ncbi:MAG: hypothetical protein C4549_04700 [Deltaproteobacteria bacterium]|nr:MAG: hypothetical protein C4549_04700 [Deltaproteobacteria bacterium]
MDIEKVRQWRSATGKAAAILCVVLSLLIIDALVAGFMQPINVFDLLPGTSVEINGVLAEKVRSVQELAYTSSSNLIQLSIDSIQKGHWFGENMWQGRLTTSSSIRQGEYTLVVGIKGKKIQKPPHVFLIRVHKDYMGYRQSFKSLMKRHFNISPWVAVVSLSPLVVLAFGCIFLLSRKVEYLMAEQGKAEVYKAIKGEGGYEIAFGLGARHGIRVNTCLALLNEMGKPVGTVVVHKVSETDSLATAEYGCTVKPGYIVSLQETE